MNQHRQELKDLIKLGVPAVLAQLSQMSLGVIDTMMAGRVDAKALAAIAVGTNILNPLIVFVLGVFLALNPIVAHLNGRGEFSRIGAVFQQSSFLALILSIPCMILLNHATPLMVLLNIQQELIPVVEDYLSACSFGLGSLFLFLSLRFCNEGLFSTKAIMIVSISAIPFNIAFNYWFIWGGLGLPAMGAVGVGYATSLVWTVMFIGILLYSLNSPRYVDLEIKSRWHPIDWQQLKEVFKLGIPMGVGVGMEIALFAIVGLLIGSYSIEMVAAHQIAINIASMAYMVPLGLSIALSARVGFFAGRNNHQKARHAGYVGIALSIALAVFSALIMFSIPNAIISLYTDDTSVTIIAVELMLFAAIFQLSDATQVSSSGALRGLKDTKVPMFISAVAYWLIGFPVGYYCAEVLNMTAKGYWIGIVAGLSSAAFLLLSRYYLKMKKYV